MILPDNIPVYGDTSYRGKCPTETAEQITLFAALRKTRYGAVALHIKNEGKRKHGQVSWDKANGLVKGASDIMIPGAPAFVCELKRKDHIKSRISYDQIAYLENAQSLGAFACIALGWESAWQAVKDWEALL